MKLVFEYLTLNDVMHFNIMNDNKQVGELYAIKNLDCYVIQAKPYVDFYLINQKLDDKLNELFENLFEIIDVDPFFDSDLPILLLEDESIANRYAIVHNLRKVPRYNGFYLYNC